MAHAELHGVVALDGPSGTGKSTVARELAATSGTAYLDTGAMYRAATLAALRAQVEPSDADAVERVLRSTTLEVTADAGRPSVAIDGVAVNDAIREPEVTGAVSAVSAMPAVRELLVARQRELVREALDHFGGVVVEGRDIGTVVVPDAGLKVYLTASTQVRALRRSSQDLAAGRSADRDGTRDDMQRRDASDSSRAVSPLRMADDAVELDTTQLDVRSVLEQLRKLAESRGLLSETPGASR